MGRHHKPSTTGKNIAKAALVLTALPAGTALLGAGTASAAEAPSGILDEIARCESGGNPNAQNPNSTASGTYQFLDGTWQSVTGLSGSASDYSPAQQRAAAEKLLAQQGTSPWNASKSCWGGASGASQPASERHSTPKAQKKVERKAEVSRPKAQHKAAAPKASVAAADSGRSADGTGTYTCTIAKLHFDACDPDNLGETVKYPRFDQAAATPADSGGRYSVKAGDTLGEIAAKHGTTVDRLAQLNKIADPDVIFTGDLLRV